MSSHTFCADREHGLLRAIAFYRLFPTGNSEHAETVIAPAPAISAASGTRSPPGRPMPGLDEGEPSPGDGPRLAHESGVSAFCYFFPSTTTHAAEELVETMLRRAPDFPFCICWEDGSFDAEVGPIGRSPTADSASSVTNLESTCKAFARLFRDSRYVRMNQRPLLLLESPARLSTLLSVLLHPHDASDEAAGIRPYLVAVCGRARFEALPEGLDAAVEFPPAGLPAENLTQRAAATQPELRGQVYSYRTCVAHALGYARPGYKLFGTAMCGWARCASDTREAVIFSGSTPDVFGYWVERIAHQTLLRFRGDERLVFLRSWNESDVGCRLEWDPTFGRQYLTAVRDALDRSASGIPPRPPWPLAEGHSSRTRIVRSSVTSPGKLDGRSVSVVMPAYNHAAFVVAALQSVIAQTHANLEVIVVDDGSTDDTGRQVDDFAARCHSHRLTVVHQTNAGAHEALNRGMALASGEVLALMNSDDTVAPTRISDMLAAMSANASSFAFSNTRFVDDRGAELGAGDAYVQALRRSITEGVAMPDPIDALIKSNIAISSGNFVFERTLLAHTGGFCAMQVCHDWDFILAASYLTRITMVDAPLYRYRVHPHNTYAQRGLVTRLEIEQVLSRFFADIERHPMVREPATRPSFIAHAKRSGLTAYLPASLR